jgi:hypothetical protein
MMQMLQSGGVEVVTDNVRIANTDNPRGYYELEKVKKIKQDISWLPAMRGKAFKLLSRHLYDLPEGEEYRIIFMERDLDEVFASQEKMLQHLGRRPAPRNQTIRSFQLHLEKVRHWLRQQRHIEVLRVRYNELVQRPEVEAERVSQFLGGNLSAPRMAKTVEPYLYRNRKCAS